MDKWRSIVQQRWQSLTPLQRLLASCTALVALFAVWDLALMGPLKAQQSSIQEEQIKLDQQLHELAVNAIAGEEAKKNNPLIQANQKAASLKLELEKLDAAIDEKLRHFLKPDQFADILQQMLVNSSDLSLISLRTKIPEPLNQPLLEKENRRSVDLFQQSLAAKLIEQQRAIEGGDIDHPLMNGQVRRTDIVYRYPLAITFSGDYFDTLAYLKKLESMEWRPVWETLEYEVTGYPQAKVTLQIYTLSRG
ncbi:MAG TPA: hypothetical protein DCZ03_10965 [Gammaproteobacteria bacterium]|nr:hypothetical protein [Gammaproteobacteria bacterium]